VESVRRTLGQEKISERRVCRVLGQNPGRGGSRICGPPARPTGWNATRHMRSPSGWATRRSWPPSTIWCHGSIISRTWWAVAATSGAAGRRPRHQHRATRIASPQASAAESIPPHETTEPTATTRVTAGSSEIVPVSKTGPVGDI